MIDNISLKIISELSRDGRCSNVKLAHKIGINVATVARKIDALIEEGIIAIKAQRNPYITGYHAQAFIGLYVDLKKIDGVCHQLKNNTYVHAGLTSFGRFNVLLIVFFPDWKMLQNFIIEELSRMEGIKNIETYMILEETKKNNGIFLPDSAVGKPKMIDEIDQKLIEELIKNGRASYADLANKLEISGVTISRRVAALLKENIIKIVAVPNPSKLGYSASAVIGVRAEPAKVEKIRDQLSSHLEINWILRLTNNFDLLFSVDSANNNTLREFLRRKIANIDGILSIETFICMYFRSLVL